MSTESYIGKSPTYGIFQRQEFTATGTGSQTVALDYAAGDPQQLLIFINVTPGSGGVVLDPVGDYTLDSLGTTLTITATGSGDAWIIWLGHKITGPRFSTSHITSLPLLSAPVAADEFVIYDNSETKLKRISFANIEAAFGTALTLAGDVGGILLATVIQPDSVTYDKMQDIVTDNRVLGAVSAGTVTETQVVTAMIANDAVGSNQLGSVVRLDIKNSAGVTVKTIFGAGV
tara:strand:- start:13422 stop:14114 length:693 start_codon:yes stop_codon:yes gene_type:complete